MAKMRGFLGVTSFGAAFARVFVVEAFDVMVT
jgi:hypothetical protein